MALYGPETPRWGEPWSGFDQLRREIDNLFGSRGARGSSFPQLRSPNVFPWVNLYETTDNVILTAELPGVRVEDLEISSRGSQLILRGQRRIEYPKDASVHRLERRAGTFNRSVELPFAVETDKVEASYRNGVLLVRLPKPAAQQPRKIQVQAS